MHGDKPKLWIPTALAICVVDIGLARAMPIVCRFAPVRVFSPPHASHEALAAAGG
jgi:hypothetical protein